MAGQRANMKMKEIQKTQEKGELIRPLDVEKRNYDWFWFIFPALLLISIFLLLPVIITFVFSFTNMSSLTGFKNWNWIGLKNYISVFMHPSSPDHVFVTIEFVLFTLIFFNVGLGLLIALITTHISRKAGFFFRTLWILPRITPVVVYVMMWKRLMCDAPYGVFNQLFVNPLGFETMDWTVFSPLFFIILVNGYVGASFGMIIFSSSIEAISQDIMNAALVDGCNVWNRIKYIIIPHLRWALLFVTVFQSLSLLTTFELIFLCFEGTAGTEVWSLWAYHKALYSKVGNFQWAYGITLNVFLVVIGIIMAFIYLRFFKFKELIEEPKIETL